MRGVGGLDRGAGSGGGEVWLDSRFSVKVELVGFVDGLREREVFRKIFNFGFERFGEVG